MSKLTIGDVAYMIHRGFSVEQKPIKDIDRNAPDYPDLGGETGLVWHDQTELLDSWMNQAGDRH